MVVSVVISKSPLKTKKLRAVFYENGKKIKTTNFGAKGYSDYTIHQDDKRKERYLGRHKKNENWNDYMSAGSLSRWILWNKKSLESSIKDFKKRFKLK